MFQDWMTNKAEMLLERYDLSDLLIAYGIEDIEVVELLIRSGYLDEERDFTGTEDED